MPASEIDDIFSGKAGKPVTVRVNSEAGGKLKAVDEPSSSSSKKKKAKKRKRHENEDGETPVASSSKLADTKANNNKLIVDDDKKAKAKRPRVVETVRDPSAIAAPPPPPPPKSKSKVKSKSTKGENPVDDIDRFKDSRGMGPRKKTEEGFLVFKEDELGIRDEGGDTPLCPFDCDCCF